MGIDVGTRRIGLAISDPTQTLARPLATLTVKGPEEAVTLVTREVARLAAEEDGLAAIIVGMPRRLDGSASPQTEWVERFTDALATRTGLPVVLVDERLTSREAESRLSEREPDWRRRKPRLDAAAAAIILQDYLDRGD